MQSPVLSARSALSVVPVAAALAVGVLGLHVFFTERGVANEINGFVLMLLAAVLFIGGCVLWELRAIRQALEQLRSR